MPVDKNCVQPAAIRCRVCVPGELNTVCRARWPHLDVKVSLGMQFSLSRGTMRLFAFKVESHAFEAESAVQVCVTFDRSCVASEMPRVTAGPALGPNLLWRR